MSQREKIMPLQAFVQEEMALCLGDKVMSSIASLPAVTRLRVLAFLHFVNEPGKLSAQLDFVGSGDLRLTLVAKQPPEPNHH